MKVILLKDIKGIGKRFEEKEVSSGHAINFLIPQKLVVPADSPAAAQAKNQKAQEEKSRNVKNEALTQEVAKLANTEVRIALKANEKGHLFASLNADKISELLKEQGTVLDSHSIALKSPIKETGTHSIPVHIGGKETHFNLIVEGK